MITNVSEETNSNFSSCISKLMMLISFLQEILHLLVFITVDAPLALEGVKSRVKFFGQKRYLIKRFHSLLELQFKTKNAYNTLWCLFGGAVLFGQIICVHWLAKKWIYRTPYVCTNEFLTADRSCKTKYFQKIRFRSPFEKNYKTSLSKVKLINGWNVFNNKSKNSTK